MKGPGGLGEGSRVYTGQPTFLTLFFSGFEANNRFWYKNSSSLRRNTKTFRVPVSRSRRASLKTQERGGRAFSPPLPRNSFTLSFLPSLAIPFLAHACRAGAGEEFHSHFWLQPICEPGAVWPYPVGPGTGRSELPVGREVLDWGWGHGQTGRWAGAGSCCGQVLRGALPPITAWRIKGRNRSRGPLLPSWKCLARCRPHRAAQ